MNLNVQTNLLPQHEKASVNLIDDGPGSFYEIHDVRLLGRNLVKMHCKQDHQIREINMMQEIPESVQNSDIFTMNVNLVALHSILSHQHDLPSHDYNICSICSKDDQGCLVVQEALQRQLDLGWIQDCREKDCYQVNMVQIFDIRLLNTSLVGLHAKQVRLGFLTSHNYQDCKDFSKGNQGCSLVQRNLQHLLDHWWLPIYQN